MKDAFRERERALEEEFFHKVDQRLLENFKKNLSDQSERQHLMAATGITNESLIDELVELGVSHEALAAVSLIPLVLVAWADGKMDAREKPALLKAADELGIDTDGSAGLLLKSWLDKKPAAGLGLAWKHYVQAVLQDANDPSREAWRDETLRRANAIAKVSGGTLGFGSVSPSEKRAIEELRQAFMPS